MALLDRRGFIFLNIADFKDVRACAPQKSKISTQLRWHNVTSAQDPARTDFCEPQVKELHDLGVRVAMITGDSQAVADSVAKRIGIDEVAAQVLPADKASAVARFQAGGKKVAMV